MEEKKFINKVYLSSLWAVTVAVLLVQICSIVNNIVVGRLVGSDALSVMSLVSPVSFAFATVGSLLAVGGSILSARSIGQRNFGRSTRYLTTVLATILLIGGLLTALGMIFPDGLMDLLGVPDALRDYAGSYLKTYLPVAVAAMGIYVPFNFLKINGDQKVSVYLFAIMAVCNIGLDVLFSGVMDMGIAGIGLATTLGNWVSFLLGVLFLFSKRGGYQVKFAKKIWQDLASILALGSPSATNNLANLLRAYFMNLILVAAMPDGGLTTFSIISTAISFAVVAYNGVSMSMAQFIAVFSTERDVTGQKQVFRTAMLSGLLMTSLLGAVIAIFPSAVCGLFSVASNPARDMALRMFALSIVPAMINSVIIAFHQSNGHTVIANILTALRGCALVVLFALLLARVAVGTLWLCFLLAEGVTLACAAVFAAALRRKKKQLSRMLLIDTAPQWDGKSVTISIGTNNEDAVSCADQIREFCEQNDLPPKMVMCIGLAIEEIIVSFNDNALSGLKKPGMSHVRVLVYEDLVLLRFRTGGRLFDPLANAKDDDDPMSMTLGVRMVTKLASSISYNRVFGINNLVIVL